MATQIAPQFEVDCALMAGRAYQENRFDINKFPIPEGWIEFFHVPNVDNPTPYPTSSGFEAVSFVRGTAGLNQQIVISFAGTEPTNITGDWLAAKATQRDAVNLLTSVSEKQIGRGIAGLEV